MTLVLYRLEFAYMVYISTSRLGYPLPLGQGGTPVATLNHRVDGGMTWPRGKFHPLGPLTLGRGQRLRLAPRIPNKEGSGLPQE